MVWFSDTALLTPGSKVFFFLRPAALLSRLYFSLNFEFFPLGWMDLSEMQRK